jgi:hypothetical protein
MNEALGRQSAPVVMERMRDDVLVQIVAQVPHQILRGPVASEREKSCRVSFSIASLIAASGNCGLSFTSAARKSLLSATSRASARPTLPESLIVPRINGFPAQDLAKVLANVAWTSQSSLLILGSAILGSKQLTL